MALAWLTLVVIAGLAWVMTLAQARDMGIVPGTMGLALPLFLGMWLLMMAAMMLPSVAPVAILWTRSIAGRSTGWTRAGRMTAFLAGYLLAWTGYGLLAFAMLVGSGRLVSTNPGASRWLGAGIFALAGVYQLTPLKEVCLRHCRSPMTSLMHYASYRGRTRDLRIGIHHGAFCVGCCWGLMIVLVAVGVMNVAAMAALAAIVFLEKLWRRGLVLSRALGVAFIALALFVPSHPWLLPGLHRAGNTKIMGGS